VKVFQGQFYSTAFQVLDDDAFEADPLVKNLLRHLDIFSGREDGSVLHCIANSGGKPKTRLKVMRDAIDGLLADAGPGTIPLEDDNGLVATLQEHLHPDYGIVIVNEGEEEFVTYIASDCAGWSRKFKPKI
jgi:hypothetical protein